MNKLVNEDMVKREENEVEKLELECKILELQV
jgi:hypothetical protein